MPPVKSSAKLKPLVAIAPTATSISSRATDSDTQRIRMKSMLLSYGNTLNGFILRAPLDRDRLQLALAAVDQRGDTARDRHRGVGGGNDAEHRGHAETLQRAAAEREHRKAGEEGGDVGVEDGAGRAVVALGDRF